MPNPIGASEELIAEIKQHEGYIPVARHLPIDRPGVFTGGFGETHVVAGETHTQSEWEVMLRNRVQLCADQVNRLVKVSIDQKQLDALVDFVYNLGPGALQGHTLLHKLNLGDYAGADAEFPKWVYANNKKLSGLVTRREEEAEWFRE